MSVRIYIEGGGDSKEQGIRLQRAFTKLFERMGFQGKMPSLRLCGGRNETFDDFKIAHRIAPAGKFIAMLVDSEDPIRDIEATWEHLKKRDNWDKPANAENEQVLLMVTCMESWIITDRTTLQSHYRNLQISALPPLDNMETRNRHHIQDAIVHATRDCSNKYSKGKRSFDMVAKLNPDVLKQHLPGFNRFFRVLNEKC
ncbi:MAG: DUF4276 family protein [Phycisphaeraceae bacterium]